MAKYYYLTPVLGGPGAPRYPVGADKQLVGRSDRAAIALLEPTVSREHATILTRDDEVHLEDLSSKHGTFVNSKRVSTIKLRIGDIIVFGLSLVLRLEETDQPIPRAPTLDSPPTENTISTVEPLPKIRPQDETRVTAAPPPGRAKATDRAPDADRLIDQLVKMRKLAAAGALCATRLPGIHDELTSLYQAVESRPLAQEDLLAALKDSIDELYAIRNAINVPTPLATPTALFDVVRRAVAAVKPVAAPRNIDLLVGVAADTEVMADPVRLQSALIEILRNAAEASPSGQAVEIGASTGERAVTMTITDHGEGVAEDVASRLFDPFLTLRSDHASLGIGLFEARQLILSMGGNLTLHSEEGHGTTVRIDLQPAH